MPITFDEAVEAQAALERTIFHDPNVVSVGVIAERDQHGDKTDNYSLQVGVISSEALLQANDTGCATIPSKLPIQQGDTTKHVIVKVVHEGIIEPQEKLVDIPAGLRYMQPQRHTGSLGFFAISRHARPVKKLPNVYGCAALLALCASSLLFTTKQRAIGSRVIDDSELTDMPAHLPYN